jgi:hypothetical protein
MSRQGLNPLPPALKKALWPFRTSTQPGLGFESKYRDVFDGELYLMQLVYLEIGSCNIHIAVR